MMRFKSLRWIAAGTLAALLLCAATAVAQDRGRGGRDRGRDGGRRERVERNRRDRERQRHRRAQRKARMDRLMNASDEQVRASLDAAREVARVREASKARAAEVVVAAWREAKDATPEARAQIRERTRAALREIRAAARGPLVEAGKKALATLTPEQRKGLEERFRARGIEATEERLALGFGRRLAHPFAESVLKARLGETR